MTGDDIVTEVRLNFGEAAALTLADTDIQSWVNTALKELYSLLPLSELLVLAETTAVALTAGKGTIPATLDHLLSVEVSAVPASALPLEAIQVIDRNEFFWPFVPVYATDGEHLWVRDDTGSPASADVTHVDPPAAITNFALEVILPKWHAVLVLLATAFAYAQEEDKGQAQHYRNEALALINRGQGATAPEQEAL